MCGGRGLPPPQINYSQPNRICFKASIASKGKSFKPVAATLKQRETNNHASPAQSAESPANGTERLTSPIELTTSSTGSQIPPQELQDIATFWQFGYANSSLPKDHMS